MQEGLMKNNIKLEAELDALRETNAMLNAVESENITEQDYQKVVNQGFKLQTELQEAQASNIEAMKNEKETTARLEEAVSEMLELKEQLSGLQEEVQVQTHRAEQSENAQASVEKSLIEVSEELKNQTQQRTGRLLFSPLHVTKTEKQT